jgi:hypothetical protein
MSTTVKADRSWFVACLADAPHLRVQHLSPLFASPARSRNLAPICNGSRPPAKITAIGPEGNGSLRTARRLEWSSPSGYTCSL